MRVRRTVKEKDVIKILVFGCDRKHIKSAMDSGFRSMSAVLSYANCMAGNKPVNHIRVSNGVVDGVAHIPYMGRK